MTAILLAALLSQTPASETHSILQGPSSWIILRSDGAKISEFAKIDGKTPTQVAISKDASTLLFSAPRASKKDGLFIKILGRPMRDISISDGYHGWPALTPDGRIAFFTHNSGNDSGPVGAHGMRSNAQLWRLQLGSQGGRPTQLTQTPGCKSSPSTINGTRVYFTHNTCHGMQGIEVLPAAKQTPEIIVQIQDNAAHLPKPSPDGNSLLLTRAINARTQLSIITPLNTKQERVLFITGENERIDDATWLNANEVAFVVKARILSTTIDTTQSRELMQFQGGGENE